jgi:hypothetical protein
MHCQTIDLLSIKKIKMAKKTAITEKVKATETKADNFTISIDGDTISTGKAAVMIKLAEAAVFLETVEDVDGQLILSRKRAKHMRTWEKILKAEDEDVILEGRIKRRTKGGFVVDIDGIEAFCPAMTLSADERSTKEKAIKLRIVHTEPLQNTLILGSGVLPKAEVKLMASLLNMREIISLHIGQA